MATVSSYYLSIYLIPLVSRFNDSSLESVSPCCYLLLSAIISGNIFYNFTLQNRPSLILRSPVFLFRRQRQTDRKEAASFNESFLCSYSARNNGQIGFLTYGNVIGGWRNRRLHCRRVIRGEADPRNRCSGAPRVHGSQKSAVKGKRYTLCFSSCSPRLARFQEQGTAGSIRGTVNSVTALHSWRCTAAPACSLYRQPPIEAAVVAGGSKPSKGTEEASFLCFSVAPSLRPRYWLSLSSSLPLSIYSLCLSHCRL